MGLLIDDLIKELGIKRGPDVPSGIMARQIDSNHYLFLNVSNETKEIQLAGHLRSILWDRTYDGKFSIPPFEPEFIEIR